MAFHNDDYCRGIALVIQGESIRAAAYVTQGTSLGTLREKIVSNFVRNETPERFRVETGFIRNHESAVTSRQCDILVHEPWMTTPLYRYDDFVIVNAGAARAVIEVKSDLDKERFKELLDVHASIVKVELSASGVAGGIPTFGYGITGATIQSLAKYLKEALIGDRLKGEGINDMPFQNWPFCIAIQNRSIIGLRPQVMVPGQQSSDPCYFCLADLTKVTDVTMKPVGGIETGFFLHFYSSMIRNERFLRTAEGTYAGDYHTTTEVYKWFNSLPVSVEGKFWINPKGEINQGPIPLKANGQVV